MFEHCYALTSALAQMAAEQFRVRAQASGATDWRCRSSSAPGRWRRGRKGRYAQLFTSAWTRPHSAVDTQPGSELGGNLHQRGKPTAMAPSPRSPDGHRRAKIAFGGDDKCHGAAQPEAQQPHLVAGHAAPRRPVRRRRCGWMDSAVSRSTWRRPDPRPRAARRHVPVEQMRITASRPSRPVRRRATGRRR